MNLNIENKTKIWDVVVIGGGPAGMMAAGRAASLKKQVLLLEKNATLGKKLLITGGGRCNLTNNKPEVGMLVDSYKGRPKALFSVFTQFDVNATLNFFHSCGMQTKIEAEGRVFPISNKAESVWQVMVDYIANSNVTVKTGASVQNIEHADNIFTTQLEDGVVSAKSCVVATGGTSHPETGSTGDAYKWLKSLGHTIIENNFALVPIAVKEAWVQKVAGVSLQDIKIGIFVDNKKLESRKGKILFTHFGVSGPTVLNMSSKIGELLESGVVTLEIDLLPTLDHGQLKQELNDLLSKEINKKLKNVLGQLIPSALVEIAIEVAQADGEKANNSVTKEERQSLIKTLKGLPLTVKSLLGADKAVVSAGGVKIDEVDFKTMQSRIIPGLFLVGDVLDIDRPSGGYSLQICWSSGYVAGSNC